MNDLRIETNDVQTSGQNQKGISSNFIESVENIFNTIETICASEWLGFSATTFNEVSTSYHSPMRELGERIDSHGNSDITSATQLEETDSELAGQIRNI